MNKFLSSILLAGMSWSAASAVKAQPGIIEYRQPDGSIVEIMLHGDENFHYATNLSNNILLHDSKGFLREGTIRDVELRFASASDRRARAAATRASSNGAKYRYSDSAFPTIGQPHSLVILVEYPDYGFSMDDPAEYYEDFLNGQNFTRDGGTGSVKKYYSENSFGQFVPTFDVYGPVMTQYPRKYYGSGDERNASQMVVEAVKALDSEVDFSQYDHNNDGLVDSVYIIYAHKGEADSNIEETIWPFSWELISDGIILHADGVQFNTYGMSNELKSNGRVEGIGTFTHEFGHVLGLPDLYNTDNIYDTTTPCAWSVMDNGNYNNSNRTPCNLSSFERYSLGWLAPDEIVADGTYYLDNLADRNKAFIMTTEENPDEFFLMENRRMEGWDLYLPAQGMLIWHIDFLQSKWDQNVVNNRTAHHYVDLVRADNDRSYSFKSNLGDPFPGSENVTVFSNTTRPVLKSWKDKDLNVTSVYDIADREGRIYFSTKVSQFRGDASVGEISMCPEYEITGRTLNVAKGSVPVYDISGRIIGVASPDRSLTLEPGLYIIGGRKVLL